MAILGCALTILAGIYAVFVGVWGFLFVMGMSGIIGGSDTVWTILLTVGGIVLVYSGFHFLPFTITWGL